MCFAFLITSYAANDDAAAAPMRTKLMTMSVVLSIHNYFPNYYYPLFDGVNGLRKIYLAHIIVSIKLLLNVESMAGRCDDGELIRQSFDFCSTWNNFRMLHQHASHFHRREP